MKIAKLKSFRAGVFYIVIILFTAFSLSSCAKKIAFATSTVVPAAEGKVKVKNDKNKNYNIALNVIRLVDPKRLIPAKETYVVWMQTEQNGIKNIGQLKTSSGLFSKTLKSSLQTATAFKPVRFFITAENNGNIQYPGMQVVLTTPNF